MQGLWQRFVSSLTPAVRLALSVWTILYLLGIALGSFHIANLAVALMLTGPAVFHGQVWRLASYALLPLNLLDLVMSGISLIIFGGMLERVWTRRDFLLYCLFAAIGAGLVKIAFQSINPLPLLGPSPIAFALMAATGRLFAHEKIILPPSFEMNLRGAVIVLATLSFFTMGCMAGWVNAIIRVSGGVFGILYLWLRSEIEQPREARPAVSQRINRLEL